MRFIALLCGLLFGAAEVARAYEQDRMSVGSWEGAAYFDDKARAFSHCAMSAAYRNGVDVFLLYSDSGFAVAFGNQSWNLRVGEQYDFDLNIDNRWSKHVTGSVPIDGTIRVDLGTDERAVAAFRFGNLLTLQARSGTFQFSLERTSAAIAALHDCYAAHTRPNESNPFAGNTRNPFATTAKTESPDQSTVSPWRVSPPELSFQQFKQIMENSLDGNVVTGSADGKYGDAEYLVTNGAVVGAFWEEDSRTRTPDQVVANFTGALQQECQGSAASSITSRYSKGAYEIRAGFSACREQNDAITYTALTVLSVDGRADIFAFIPYDEHLTDSTQADVDKANESVRSFLVDLVNKNTM